MASIAPLDASPAANVAGASRGLGDQQAAPNNRRLVTSVATVFCFVGFTMSINGIGAPWIAKSFHLGESGIASLFAWISFSAIGALGLSRMIDRMGRRRMLLVCIAGTSVSALAAAFSTNIALHTVRDRALRLHRRDALRRYRYPCRGTSRSSCAREGRAGAGSGWVSVAGYACPDADGGASSLMAMDARAGVGDGSRRAVEIGPGHPGKRPLATRRRKRHDFGQQLLRCVRTTLSTPRDHGPVLLVAGQYRGGRGQQLGVFPPGLGREIGAGRRQRSDADRRRRRDARLSARRARMRALRPHPNNFRRGHDDQSRRARLLLGSSGALGP